jgi:hypothetical protein
VRSVYGNGELEKPLESSGRAVRPPLVELLVRSYFFNRKSTFMKSLFGVIPLKGKILNGVGSRCR